MQQILKTRGYFVRWWNDQDKEEPKELSQKTSPKDDDALVI